MPTPKKVGARAHPEYKDDNYSIPRSSQVIVRRLPPSRPGRGTAQLYVADMQAPAAGALEPPPSAPASSSSSMYRGPMTRRFDGRDVGAAQASAPAGAQGDDEAARIAAMFQATTDNWDETQERMAQYVHILTQRHVP